MENVFFKWIYKIISCHTCLVPFCFHPKGEKSDLYEFIFLFFLFIFVFI
jgi:hypothetical protein